MASVQLTSHRTSPWLTPVEAAEYLGIALGTLRNWTSARFLPFAKQGHVVRYHRDEIDRWLQSRARLGRATFGDPHRPQGFQTMLYADGG